VVQIGKDLDLVTTIEGVETEVQLNFVTNHTRADLIQGFLYGAPMSFDAISRLLEQQIYRQNTVPLRLVSST